MLHGELPGPGARPPYRAPAFELRAESDPGAGLGQALVEEIEAALGALADPDLPRLKAVHAARRHVKRARTVVRLLRPMLGAERSEAVNTALREGARTLSGDRDADVLAALSRRLAAEAPEAAGPAFEAVAERATGGPRRGEAGVAEASACLARALRIVHPLPASSKARELVGGEIAALYAKGRRAMRRAKKSRDDEALHDWRKRVKDRWHAARLMKRIWPEGDRPATRALDELGELLGADHDMAVLRAALELQRGAISAEAFDEALAAVKKRKKKMRRRIFALGRELYGKRPKDFAKAWRKGFASAKARSAKVVLVDHARSAAE